MIRRILFAIYIAMLLSMAASVSAQPTIVQSRVNEQVYVNWSYLLADVPIGAVVKFTVGIDNLPPINTGLPPTATSYTFPLPKAQMTIGLRVIKVSACSLSECATAIINHTVMPAVPVPPSNIHITMPPVPIVTNQALEIAEAYSILYQGRRLTTAETQFLVSAFIKDGRALTEPNVKSFIEENMQHIFANVVGEAPEGPNNQS